METLYGQTVSHFALTIFLKEKFVAEGQPIIDLAEHFISKLLVPPYKPVNLTTIRSGATTRDNSGPFNERRWNDTRKKLISGHYGFVFIDGKVHENEKPSPWFLASFNNKEGEDLAIGSVTASFPLPYVKETTSSWVSALLDFGKSVWKGLAGGAAYGWANIALSPEVRPLLIDGQPNPDYRPAWEAEVPPDRRAHAVPVAYTAGDRELRPLYVAGKGIKGAFWANFLDEIQVKALGGERKLREGLGGCKVENLASGGLLIAATDHPLPPDAEDNRERFLVLHRALQPVFLERNGLPAPKRELLSYFYRERESVLP